MKQPVFNLPTETKALYCFEHKQENMIDINHKRCISDNCMKRPNFNFSTETKPLYCFEHKLENMISVKKKHCQATKCKEIALFGFINKRAQFCLVHKAYDKSRTGK